MINKIEVLKEYRDKAYVSAFLCQMTSEYYSRYKNILQIPLIISSAVMTVLNASDFDSNHMKYSNVVLNTCTALILSMSNNFKIPEKCAAFRSTSIKFVKLTHTIEDKILYNESVDREDVRDIIIAYDAIFEGLEYSFPDSIKKKVIKMYKGVRVLPNILNCEGDIVPIHNNEEITSSSIVYKTPKVLDKKIINGLQSIEEEVLTAEDVIRRPSRPFVLKVKPQSPITEEEQV